MFFQVQHEKQYNFVITCGSNAFWIGFLKWVPKLYPDWTCVAQLVGVHVEDDFKKSEKLKKCNSPCKRYLKNTF